MSFSDTIKLKLKNLRKHKDIDALCRNSEDVIAYEVHPDSGGRKKGSLEDGMYLVYDVVTEHREIIYEKSGNKSEYSRLHNRYNPSSHYKILVRRNVPKDCLFFEFSLPKYYYGTNVIQTIENPFEKEFLHLEGLTDQYQFHAEHGFARLVVMIKNFFKREFPMCPIDFDEVEILQHDYCFNQVFKTRQDALRYLDLQKNIKKTYLRPESSNYQVYPTSIFISGSGYKAEIYHKGTEYEINDRPKHEHINAKFQKSGLPRPFNVEYLQSLADRTLRYEVSVKREKFSYLYNTKIFRKNSKSFQVMKEIYNKLKSKYDRNQLRDWFDVEDIVMHYEKVYINDSIAPVVDYIVSYFNRSPKAKYHDFNPHDYFSGLEKFRREFEACFVSKGRNFYLDLSMDEYAWWNHDKKSNQNMFDTRSFCLFNNEIYQEGLKWFWEFVKEFQVEQKGSINDYSDKIDEVNKQRSINKLFKRKPSNCLDKGRLLTLVGFLEFYNLDQLKKMMSPNRQEYDDKIEKIKKDKSLSIEAKEDKILAIKKDYKRACDSADRVHRKRIAELKEIGINRKTLHNPYHIDARIDFFHYYNELKSNRKWIVSNAPFMIFPKRAKISKLQTKTDNQENYTKIYPNENF